MIQRSWVALLWLVACLTSVQAASFNSTLPLKVFARQATDVSDRLIGFTPTRGSSGIRTPSNGLWYVRPMGPLTAELMSQLVREVRAGRISGIDLSDRWDVSNDHLATLRELSGLRILLLAHTKINDQGLGHLQSLKNLEVLSVSPMTTDHGLAKLKNLNRLRELDLSGSRVTDQGLSLLQVFKRLERLALGHATTDKGIFLVASLSSLKELDLRSTRVTDKGLAPLTGLPHLEWLSVNGAVTQEGGLAIGVLSSLKTVVVDGIPMPIAVLGHLRDMQGLDNLSTDRRSLKATRSPIEPLALPSHGLRVKSNFFAAPALKDAGNHGLQVSKISHEVSEQALLTDVTPATSQPKIEIPEEPSENSSLGDISVQVQPIKTR